MGYLWLFLSALGAATLLPLQSESVLAALLAAGELSRSGLWLTATLGNVLGAAINWWLGRFMAQRLPLQRPLMQRARNYYMRYGYWSLLLSWTPIIGDPLTLIAGWMREPLWRFLLLVSIAKGGRYLVVIWAMQSLSNSSATN